MLSHCGVSADTIGVHQGDEFRLREVARRGSLAIRDIGFRGLEDLVEDEVRELGAALPFLVRVDVEVVSVQDDEAGGEEDFVAVLDLDGGGFAFGVFGAAGEEAADDELVDFALVVLEGGWRYVVDWVDGRVGLVAVAAVSWLLEASVE